MKLATAVESVVIHEIYSSVQGESSFVGLPCTFVRMSACNLRCTWCDTPQAFTGGTRRAIDSVLDEALSKNTPLVEVTGGEPLLQPGALPLLRALCDSGKTVLLETSGERDISPVDPRVHRIMDIKAPGSGECERNRWENINHLTRRDEVKFVLADRADYEWSRDVITRYALSGKVANVLLSPVHGQLDPKSLTSWLLEDQLPARLQVQIHKYIWSPDTQGV